VGQSVPTHHTATDLKVLNQEEHILSVHEALALRLQQHGHGVLAVGQHHDHCPNTTQWGVRGRSSTVVVVVVVVVGLIGLVGRQASGL